jgi:pimeloyl-ACP methyl ester carboxylesterase
MNSSVQIIANTPIAPIAEQTIIALHGNGGGGFRFERLKPYVPSGCTLYTPTLPGFAAVPLDPAIQNLKGYADWLSDYLSDLPRPRLILGHGIGGSILLEFLQHYVHEVDAVVLHAPVGAYLDKRWFPKLMKPLWVREMGKQVFASPLSRPIFKRLLFKQDVPNAYLNQFFGEYQHCQAFNLMFDWITADWFNALQPIDIPGVLLWGKQERVLKANHVPAYERLLPNCPVVIEPQWDHFPMVEQPEHYMHTLVRIYEEVLYVPVGLD